MPRRCGCDTGYSSLCRRGRGGCCYCACHFNNDPYPDDDEPDDDESDDDGDGCTDWTTEDDWADEDGDD